MIILQVLVWVVGLLAMAAAVFLAVSGGGCKVRTPAPNRPVSHEQKGTWHGPTTEDPPKPPAPPPKREKPE